MLCLASLPRNKGSLTIQQMLEDITRVVWSSLGLHCASSSSSGGSALWLLSVGPSCCSVHQRVAFCQGAYLAQEIVSLFLLSCSPWNQRKVMLLDVLPMLICCSARTREGLCSLFRERGGCRPSLQIAVPYVPSTVTRSFHTLPPRFLSAGCLTARLGSAGPPLK